MASLIQQKTILSQRKSVSTGIKASATKTATPQRYHIRANLPSISGRAGRRMHQSQLA